jgi:hypothetical protein
MDHCISKLRVGLQAASPMEPKAVVEVCRMANVLAVSAFTWATLLMGGMLERPCSGGGGDDREEVDGSDGGGDGDEGSDVDGDGSSSGGSGSGSGGSGSGGGGGGRVGREAGYRGAEFFLDPRQLQLRLRLMEGVLVRLAAQWAPGGARRQGGAAAGVVEEEVEEKVKETLSQVRSTSW